MGESITPKQAVEYELARPSAGDVIATLETHLGKATADLLWKKALRGAKCRGDEGTHDLTKLIAVLGCLANEDGIAQVVARSQIIRVHTFILLGSKNKQPPAATAQAPRRAP